MKITSKLRDLYQNAIDNLTLISLCVILLTAYPNYLLSSLITTLTDVLGFSLIKAAIIVNVQTFCAGIFGTIGAMIIDAYLTLYGMVFFSSLICSIGFALLTFGSYHLNSLGYTDGIVTVTWLLGLGLIAVGKLSLINSAIALSGEGNKRKATVHQVVEFSVDVIIVVIFFVHDFSFSGRQFLVSAILMFLVAVVSLFYLKENFFVKPERMHRNPFKQVPPVADRPSPQNHNESLQHPLKDSNPSRPLNKIPIKEATHIDEKRNQWLFFWMCTSFVACGMVRSIGDTFFLDQGNQMDTTLGTNEIPLQGFLVLSEFINMITKVGYKIWIPKNFRESRRKYAPAIEYGVGMVLFILCLVCASWVAMEVSQLYEQSKSISVFCLTPQFVLFGAMDRLTRDGIEGFFEGQLPPSVNRYDVVFTEGIIGAGSLFAILVTKAANNWFKLDRFYHLCTVVAIAIFLVHVTVVVRYVYRDNGESQETDDCQEPKGKEQVIDYAVEMTQGSQQAKVDEQVLDDGSTQQSQPENEQQKVQNEEVHILIQPANLTNENHLERRLSRQKSSYTRLSS